MILKCTSTSNSLNGFDSADVQHTQWFGIFASGISALIFMSPFETIERQTEATKSRFLFFSYVLGMMIGSEHNLHNYFPIMDEKYLCSGIN